MRRLVIFSVVFFIASLLQAQDLDYEIAKKACENIKASDKPFDLELQKKCVSESFAEFMIKALPDEKQQLNTVTGMVSTMKKIDEILSVICFENGEESYKHLEKTYYSDSEDEVASSYYNTSLLMMNEGKYDLAIEGLEIAVNIDSNFVKAYDHLGVCYRHINNYEKSIFYYEKSLKLFSIGKVALMNIGLVYALKVDFENSNKYYQRLIDVHPNYAEGYFGIGKNYLMVNDYELGLKNIYTAHQIYIAEKSDYQEDTEMLISIINSKMKQEGKKTLFKELTKKYNVKIK